MVASRLIITASSDNWARTAAEVATGYATSIIGCDCEAGIERPLPASQTPDGRPGVSVLLFARSLEALQRSLANRVGQCIMTCPTTAAFDGLHHESQRASAPAAGQVSVGGYVRYFGDGLETREKRCLAESSRDIWRIPVMDGEFIVEHRFHAVQGIAGGQFMVGGLTPEFALEAAARGASAARACPDVITPFPAGVVRCGSKVGSKYPRVRASTHAAYCPSLRERVPVVWPAEVQCAYEVIIDGLTPAAVATAMRAGIFAAAGEGVPAITASSFGGKLGSYRFSLHAILQGHAQPWQP